MVDAVAETMQAASRHDRGALRSELEATLRAFHALLDSMTDDRWRRKSPSCAWTMGEVLVHLTLALEQLPQEVASARRGKGMFNYPQRLADPLSYWMIRWMARNATRESVGRRYAAAMAAVLRALDAVPEADWGCGARFYGHGFYTVADLLRTPAQHLAEHTAGM